MSTESKIFTGVIASTLTGLLVAFHVVDPTQADSLAGLLQTGFGLLISLVAVGYGLETLLVKHKAEVTEQHLLESSTTSPNAATATQTTETANTTTQAQ